MSPAGTLRKPSGFFSQRSFCGLVLVIIALQALAKAAAGMGLFADGSYFLLRVLAYPQIPDADPWRRWLAHVVWETPLLLALGAGLQRINLIIYFYSFCLVAIPAALWILSLWKLRLSPFFWPFLMMFSIVHLNCDLFAIGEYNLASAIAAVDMAILLQPAPLIAGDAALLVASSVFTVNTYESFVFLGPLLAGAAAARMVATRSYLAHLDFLCAAHPLLTRGWSPQIGMMVKWAGFARQCFSLLVQRSDQAGPLPSRTTLRCAQMPLIFWHTLIIYSSKFLWQ